LAALKTCGAEDSASLKPRAEFGATDFGATILEAAPRQTAPLGD